MKNLLKNLFSASADDTATTAYGAPGEGKSIHISVITVVCLFILWYISTEAFGWVRPLTFPSPVAVLNKFIDTALEGFGNALLTDHIAWSMYRVFSGFLLAAVVAIPLGILIGVNRYVRGVFDPLIEFYRPIPPLAYLPLIIIWFGIDESAKIIIIFLAVFAPMVLNTRAGVKSVAIEQIHAAYSMGATKRQILTQVILPGAMPEILTGMRIGIGFGWTTLVAAELLAAEQGLGFLINAAANFLQTSVVVMGIIVIGAIAFAFDLFMRYVESVIVPWKGRV